MKNIGLIVMLLGVPLAGGCRESGAVAAAELEAKGSSLVVKDPKFDIGDPCKGKDGWQPPNAPKDGKASKPDEKGILHGIQVEEKIMERYELPPGTGYCIPPDAAHPHGYFTMNCSASDECPAGAECTAGMCVKACSSDADCRKPTACAGRAPKFCQVADGPIRGRHR